MRRECCDMRVLTLEEVIYEKFLEEGKVVTFDGKTNPSEGWIVVMAGGSGAGKGFVLKTLVPISGKKLDPDQLKPYMIKKGSAITDNIIKFNDGSEINLEDRGIYPPYDLSNPDFVRLIHEHPLTKRLKKAQKDTLYKSVASSDSRRRPNIIFDMTLDELSKLENIISTYKPMGYKIAVVYVFTPIDVAIEQNEKRTRTVPKDILLEIHRNVYKTLPKLLSSPEIESNVDDIWIVQQLKVDTEDRYDVLKYIEANNVTRLEKGADGLRELEDELADFVKQQLKRIRQIEDEMSEEESRQEMLRNENLETARFGVILEGGKLESLF